MKLTQFYRNTVDLNDSMTGGWSKCYYGVFTDVINQNDYKNIAEIGIGYGTHAKYILKNNQNINRLYLVDPTKFYENDGFADDIMKQEPEIPGNNFNELYQLITDELNPWKDKYTWFRTESLSITNEQVPDESLDCIFIDGDHSYKAVLNDLTFWWKKLKTGGQMLGDDYWMQGVADAVNEFARNHKLSFDFLTTQTSDYKIYRFKK
jgi:hypothetical protein